VLPDETNGYHLIDQPKFNITSLLFIFFFVTNHFVLKATEDRYKNKGAYIVLKPPCFDDPEFHSFEAITPRPAV
jgi:serine/threonine-protein phosphatase 5